VTNTGAMQATGGATLAVNDLAAGSTGTITATIPH